MSNVNNNNNNDDSSSGNSNRGPGLSRELCGSDGEVAPGHGFMCSTAIALNKYMILRQRRVPRVRLIEAHCTPSGSRPFASALAFPRFQCHPMPYWKSTNTFSGSYQFRNGACRAWLPRHCMPSGSSYSIIKHDLTLTIKHQLLNTCLLNTNEFQQRRIRAVRLVEAHCTPLRLQPRRSWHQSRGRRP